MPEKIIRIPKTSLVVLCGPAASGKSTFGRRHFSPDAIFDEGRLVVAYAGIEPWMIGRLSSRIIDRCVVGHREGRQEEPSWKRREYPDIPIIVCSHDSENSDMDCHFRLYSSQAGRDKLKALQYPEKKECCFSSSD